MFGSELKNENIYKDNIVNIDNDIVEIETNQGDKIKLIYSTKKQNKDKLKVVAAHIWQTFITDYQILPEGIIYLKPKIYWEIYKRIDLGKDFIKGIGYTMYVNNNKSSFPATSFYFSNQTVGQKGVYGIYYKNELMFIGSSSDLLDTWKKHDHKFRLGAYSEITNPNEVEYRILESSDTINFDRNYSGWSMWLYELMEYAYIRALKPKWNQNGISSPFHFYADPGDLPTNYWVLCQNWLSSDRKKDEITLRKGILRVSDEESETKLTSEE